MREMCKPPGDVSFQSDVCIQTEDLRTNSISSNQFTTTSALWNALKENEKSSELSERLSENEKGQK
jgi:hypothetical protein